jgi:hypothetical protein
MTFKAKYSPELVKAICDDIAVYGTNQSGWDGRIAEDTFYRWYKSNEEFAELVNKARQEYSDSRPISRYRQANLAFNGYLNGTMEKVYVTKKTGRDSEGRDWEEEEIKRVPVGVPKWAIERIIGSQTTEEDAIRKFAEAGWISKEIMQLAIAELDRAKEAIRALFAGVLPAGFLDTAPGLTPEVSADIRARILGIEPASTFALSATVDTGSEPSEDLREESADRDLVG